MKKSEQLKKDDIWQKIPFIKTALKRWDFYKTVQESLSRYRNDLDPKELAKTVLPKKENLELHCAWVTEAYGPSNIDQLLKTMQRLGWDASERNIRNRESLTGWIRRSRGFGRGGSWMNGGVILSRGDKTRFFGLDVRRSKLPQGVDRGYLSVRSITSSLTLVTIQFFFSDEVVTSLNRPFRNSYSTKVKYHPSLLKSKVATYFGAVEQKRQAIKKELDGIHLNLYEWFSKNLPGYYSSLGTYTFPTVDLITSRLYEQRTEDTKKLKDHYTDLMFDYGTEIWKCKTDSSLELRLPWRSSERPVATLFGNYDKLTENNEMYGGRDRASLVNKLHMDFDVTMGLWASHNLLLSYEQQLSILRDRASFQVKGTRAAIKNLNFIRQHFLSISTDAQAVGNDIAELVKLTMRYSHDTLDFEPPFYFKRDNVYPDFIELLRRQAEMRTKQLIELEVRVNEAITSSGNLISTIANLRIQCNVLWLTVFVAILTLFSVFRDSILKWMTEQQNNLVNFIEIFLQS